MSPLDHVDDYPEIPVSLGSTRTALKTGQWRSVRPVLVTRRSVRRMASESRDHVIAKSGFRVPKI